MTENELIERKIVMQRLLNTFTGYDGGIDFVELRSFVEGAEGETISKILRHMGMLLDTAGVASLSVEDLPIRV